MPTSNVFNSSIVRRWLYRSSLIFFLVFFAGFCAVVPIDSISQASQSSNNYALNTFVVVGALTLFGIVAGILTTTRIYRQRSALQDIPKRYVPLDYNDMPKDCITMVNNNFKRCDKIRNLALTPLEKVRHPGLSAPDSELLPPLLSFEDVIRAIGMKLKWEDSFFDVELQIPQNYSFREVLAYLQDLRISTNEYVNKEYSELYEELRYSGKLVTQDKFIRFMELSIEFVKITRMNIELNSGTRRNPLYTSSEISKSTDGLSRFSMKNSRTDISTFNNYLNPSLAGSMLDFRDPFQPYEQDELSEQLPENELLYRTPENELFYRTYTTNTVGTTRTETSMDTTNINYE